VRITHINFLVLDVEGADISILELIDWARMTFDVVMVQTDPWNRGRGEVW
jgi:hypothetical protein